MPAEHDDRSLVRFWLGGHSFCAGPLIILAAAAVAVAPLLFRGPSCGHDFDFHLVSWLDCFSSWRHGIFYPHWTPSANYGAGEPRFVFYPPLTWMLGAALGAILPWTLVPVALTFLLLAAIGLATRFLAREKFSELPATLAGVLALSCGYVFFTAFERTAYGELVGGFWIPLLLLFALRPVKRVSSATAMALILAACWLSNAPLGVMASYLLALVALIHSIAARSLRPVLRAALAVALGLSVCGFYLIPAAYEQRWVDIAQATGDPGERIENSFFFAHHADPALAFHDVVLQQVSWIGVGIFAVALISIALLLLQKRFLKRRSWVSAETEEKVCSMQCLRHAKFAPCNGCSMRWWWGVMGLLPLVALLLQLPLSLPLWNLLPKMRFLQFPWRWLLVLEAPMALLLMAAARPVWKRLRWLFVLLTFAWCICAAFHANRAYYQVCDEEDNPATMASAFQRGGGFAGTGEYTSLGTDSTLVPSGLPAACLAASPEVKLGIALPSEGDDASAPAWTAVQHSCQPLAESWSGSPEHLRLSATLPHGGWLILRLSRYPAWRIRGNGKLFSALPQREDGLVVLPVSQGPLSLSADWSTTPDVWAGRGLSLLGVLALTALWLWKRREVRVHLS